MKHIAVLGSTGSIGTSCLDVVRAHPMQMRVVGLAAHSRWEPLMEQCREFRPRRAAIADESLRGKVTDGAAVNLQFGEEAVVAVATDPEANVVIAGIVGAAGLRGTWAAVEAGKTIGLANKETLVLAGAQVTQKARETGARLIPVDSEHSAVFQALQSGKPAEVARVILTASGGPFRGWSRSQLAEVTPRQALAHPTWQMGPKITVDSATLMNKALEIIEARWLFQLAVEQIDVVIHPQSIVHSLVEFVDGSVIAQMSPPDMRLPIQYAITYPDRLPGVGARLNLAAAGPLEFAAPDCDAFPALELGFEVARSGGTSGAVLNAANEVAVQRFLDGALRFVEIPRVCRDVLHHHRYDPHPTLEELLRQDAWARKETLRWTSSR
jgi:1-deoxy-D-xylulose-5-phosphate reductoisomerase